MGLRPHPRTSVNLTALLTGPISKHGHMGSLGFQHMNLGRHGSVRSLQCVGGEGGPSPGVVWEGGEEPHGPARSPAAELTQQRETVKSEQIFGPFPLRLEPKCNDGILRGPSHGRQPGLPPTCTRRWLPQGRPPVAPRAPMGRHGLRCDGDAEGAPWCGVMC